MHHNKPNITYLLERHPIARPLGRDMGCRSWMQSLTEVVSLLKLLFSVYYRVIDYRDISRVYNNGHRSEAPCSKVNYCWRLIWSRQFHHSDVVMSAMASQITGVTIVYPTVSSGADQRKHQSSASLAFVRGIHLWPVNSSHKGPVTRKMFPSGDVIMSSSSSKLIRKKIQTNVF